MGNYGIIADAKSWCRGLGMRQISLLDGLLKTSRLLLGLLGWRGGSRVTCMRGIESP
jgi:hypothetical protein